MILAASSRTPIRIERAVERRLPLVERDDVGVRVAISGRWNRSRWANARATAQIAATADQ